MGITTDAAIRACNALSTAWGNYSMAIGKDNEKEEKEHRIKNDINR